LDTKTTNTKRHRLSLPEKEKRHQIWQQSLDMTYLYLDDMLGTGQTSGI
jgi:hypothetical protein